jgi:signal transduction histidine kinase
MAARLVGARYAERLNRASRGARWTKGGARTRPAGWPATASYGRDCRLPITQEALTNAVKHAEAKTVDIRLARRERSVVLTIEDDGVGFSPVPGLDGKLGLVGMRERVASVNGELDSEAKTGVGTRLTVEIPLAPRTS